MTRKHVLGNFDLSRDAHGTVRIFSFDPRTNIIHKMIVKHNLILYGGADILASLLAGRGTPVNAMYMEYKNLASPGDLITPPAFDREGGISYYNGLSSSPDIDFLRIPLTVNPTVEASDVVYSGNQVVFFGVSEGTTGFHGKSFLDTVNSAVFGAALVAAEDLGDQSQDIVFSRIYSGIDKVLKMAGHQIGITWTIRFN
jgi:hypothetical protein